jgi:hypothetical protein
MVVKMLIDTPCLLVVDDFIDVETMPTEDGVIVTVKNLMLRGSVRDAEDTEQANRVLAEATEEEPHWFYEPS